jgi:hypothetical protein
MSPSPTTPPNPSGHRLDENLVAAYEATIQHHGNVIHSFSSNFVNLFALFNAGGFSASMIILPTSLGTRILTEHPDVLKWIVSLFAIGFAASGFLMVVVFDYSLHKYWEYRHALVSGKEFTEIPPSGTHYKFAAWAWVLLAISMLATFCAIGLTLSMFYVL